MNAPRPIIPCLWYDGQGEEAAGLYVSLFPNSEIQSVMRYAEAGHDIHGQEPGSVMTVEFALDGQKFVALNGGPLFKFTPAISFYVVCETAAEVDALWQALGEGGTTLMELGSYDWSDRYGWLSDRYGLSWQIALGSLDEAGQRITPTLMFTGDQAGRAETAIGRYTATFPDSAIGHVMHNGPDEANPEGYVKHAGFSLGGYRLAAMDSAFSHGFTFTEAVSLQILCEDQAEIDHYWENLRKGGDPAAQQCGWLKDEFGVSWQVAPAALLDMLKDGDRAKVERITAAFLEMKKFDIAALQRVWNS